VNQGALQEKETVQVLRGARESRLRDNAVSQPGLSCSPQDFQRLAPLKTFKDERKMSYMWIHVMMYQINN